MNVKHTIIALSLLLVGTISSCSGELEAENENLKKELTDTKSQLKEQTKIANFSKEQATTARRRADEAEKALAECNGTNEEE